MGSSGGGAPRPEQPWRLGRRPANFSDGTLDLLFICYVLCFMCLICMRVIIYIYIYIYDI